jgi:hypothetical protein
LTLKSLLLLAVVFNLGCSPFVAAPPALPAAGKQESASGNSSSKAVFSDSGTVRCFDMEGGFCGIIGDETGNFEPINLSEEFQKDGLRVKFTAIHLMDMFSTLMWGSKIEIVSIEEIEAIEFEPERNINLKEHIRNFKLE